MTNLFSIFDPKPLLLGLTYNWIDRTSPSFKLHFLGAIFVQSNLR